MRPETLWVNKNAERFINESREPSWPCLALIRQPGPSLYALLDSRIKDHIQANPTPRQIQMDGVGWFRTLDEDLQTEAGWTRKTVAIADSWDELAQKIGVDADVLQATVERYNVLCEQGRDADFVKDAAVPEAAAHPAVLRPAGSSVLPRDRGRRQDRRAHGSDGPRGTARRWPLRHRRQHQRLGRGVGPARHHPRVRVHLRIPRGARAPLVRRYRHSPCNRPPGEHDAEGVRRSAAEVDGGPRSVDAAAGRPLRRHRELRSRVRST